MCDCRLWDRLQLPSLSALTPLYEGHAEHVDPEASPAVRPSLRQLHPALAVHLGEGLREGAVEERQVTWPTKHS